VAQTLKTLTSSIGYTLKTLTETGSDAQNLTAVMSVTSGDRAAAEPAPAAEVSRTRRPGAEW
jgi:hypothetical protein